MVAIQSPTGIVAVPAPRVMSVDKAYMTRALALQIEGLLEAARQSGYSAEMLAAAVELATQQAGLVASESAA
jgi:hypothetical protein